MYLNTHINRQRIDPIIELRSSMPIDSVNTTGVRAHHWHLRQFYVSGLPPLPGETRNPEAVNPLNAVKTRNPQLRLRLRNSSMRKKQVRPWP